MNFRRWLLAILILALVVMGGLLAWRKFAHPVDTTAADLAKQQAEQAAAERAAWFDTTDRLLLFISLNDSSTALYGSNTVEKNLQRLDESLPTEFSNYLPSTQHWYTVANQTITQHGPSADQIMGTLSQQPVPTDATGFEPALAVDSTERYLVFLSRKDYTESVHLFDFTTGTDTELYQGEPNVHYGNFTFSPNSTEVAFTANDTKIITLTLEGAEIHTPISIAFHQFHSLTWITLNEFGAVITSSDANPEPFNPTVVVVDRNGAITERHPVLDKVGTPRVIWSADGSQFLFHHPWRNTFYIYNRYDQLVQQFTATAPGKLIPFGYAAGNGPFVLTPLTPDTDPGTNTNSDPTTSTPFTVTAEDWERYNSMERSIVQQWPIDLSSYRFTTTDDGLFVSFTYDPAVVTEPVELVLVQIILQSFAVLPDVPAITVVVNDTNGKPLWEVPAVSASTVDSILDSLLHMPLEQLFVINKHHPIGQRTVKPENPNYHFVGDLVYSKFGDFNPNPVLALLGAHQTETQFYANSNYVVLVPKSLSNKVLPDDTVLFYSPETEFVSTTSWTTFGITIKPYEAPGVTLEQWLSVNQPDAATEAPAFVPSAPLEVRRIATGNDYSDVYAVLSQNKVYLLTVQRDSGLTEADRQLFNSMAQSLSFFYAIQR